MLTYLGMKCHCICKVLSSALTKNKCVCWRGQVGEIEGEGNAYVAKRKQLVNLGKGYMMLIVLLLFLVGLKFFKIKNWKKIWRKGRNISRAAKTALMSALKKNVCNWLEYSPFNILYPWIHNVTYLKVRDWERRNPKTKTKQELLEVLLYSRPHAWLWDSSCQQGRCGLTLMEGADNSQASWTLNWELNLQWCCRAGRDRCHGSL